MSLATTLARAAASEQRLWRSTCLITRPGPGEAVMDPVTLQYSQPPLEVVYDGPCQVRPLRRDRDREQIVGDVALEVNEYVVKVPIDIPVRRLDDLVITSCPDVAAVNARTVVKALPASEWAPCRRLVCEEATR